MTLLILLATLIGILATLMRLGGVRIQRGKGNLLPSNADFSQFISMAIMTDPSRPYDSGNGQMHNLGGH